MSKEYLSIPCPACGRRIYLNSHGYQCEACMFHIKNYICNRRIAKHEAESIVMGKRIILDGFSSNAGEGFLIHTSNTRPYGNARQHCRIPAKPWQDCGESKILCMREQ